MSVKLQFIGSKMIKNPRNIGRINRLRTKESGLIAPHLELYQGKKK